MINLTTLNCKRIRYTLEVVRTGFTPAKLSPLYSPKIAVKYLAKFNVERSVKRNVLDNRVEYMDGWLNN